MSSKMAGIGGDTPVLLHDFTHQCLHNNHVLQELSPAQLSALPQCQAHRVTGEYKLRNRISFLAVGSSALMALAVVDLACKESGSAFYSGDNRNRQSVEVKFGDFLDYVGAASRGESHWLGTVEGLQFYLCQCPIAVFRPDETCTGAVLPTMMELFQVPDALSTVNVSQVNLWMSVDASSTSIHYDAYQNVLVVVHGKKTVKLYPPAQTKHLYAHPIYSSSSNHSQVDYVNPDRTAHPGFDSARPVILTASAGDAIYIPEGWWHQVDSEPFTVAINYWFEGFREKLVENPHMTAYYARVVMGELVKTETKQAIAEIRSRYRSRYPHAATADDVATATHSQAEREALVLGLSDAESKAVQVELAARFPVVWSEILACASEEFAVVLVDIWDRAQEGDDAQWVHAVIEPLGERADEIRQRLLGTCEQFKQGVFRRVVATTLGDLN